RAARGNIAIGEPAEKIALHPKALVAEDVGNLTRQHGPLVFGDAYGAVERRSAVPVEPHERVHPVRIESDKPPLGLEDPLDLAGQPPRIRKMMNKAAQQHAVKASAFERQV